MHGLLTTFCLLVGASGWYYLFYSRSAKRLANVESPGDNLVRVICRRINGMAMLLLGILIYVGSVTLRPEEHPKLFAADWLGVLILLGLIIILVFVDVRLTVKLRRGKMP